MLLAQNEVPEVDGFLSVDPLADKAPNWTPYRYCFNNPVNLVDPSGLWEGDYYSSKGIHLGNDGIDDHKAYLVSGFCEDANVSSYNFSKESLLAMRDGKHPNLSAKDIGITNETLNMNTTLATIRTSEGHGTPIPYNILFGGWKFESYDQHPNKIISKWGHNSSAAGAYQFLYGTWTSHAKRLGLKDFSPASQNAAAMYEISLVKGATEAIHAGNYQQALNSLSGKWTSLPGGKHEWSGFSYDIFLQQRANELNGNSILNK